MIDFEDLEEFEGELRRKKTHSRKLCWCGGHNHSNAKKNINHHGTKSKLNHRVSRKRKYAEEEW